MLIRINYVQTQIHKMINAGRQSQHQIDLEQFFKRREKKILSVPKLLQFSDLINFLRRTQTLVKLFFSLHLIPLIRIHITDYFLYLTSHS